MEKITCTIIDDEPLAIKLIENYVGKTPFLELKGSFSDSVEAISVLKENPVNLIFLDIQMPDLDGMELSKMLPEETRIIFTTAFKEYAFDSYEVNALDFLLKPIRYNKFLEAAEKAKYWFELSEKASHANSNTDQKQDSIFIKVDGMLRRIDLSQLLYVMGMKDYVVFQMRNADKEESLITHMTMTTAEEILDKKRFLRVNRSYIVALDKIDSFDRNECIHIGKEIIRITDAYKTTFHTFLKERMVKY